MATDQIPLHGIVGHGVTGRVNVYAGYSWGLPNTDELGDWFTGVVVTPKWCERLAGERTLSEIGDDFNEDAPLSIMVDNGAYPAWKRGEPLTFSDQLDGLHRAMDVLQDHHVEHIIAPDVVAGGSSSWARTLASMLELEQYGLNRLLLPLQEGIDIEHAVGVAQECDAGIFVGGLMDWKRKTIRELAAYDVWVHAGRISGDGDLHSCAMHGVNSVDSTSFTRRQHHNVARLRDYRESFERYAHRRQTGRDDQPMKPLPPMAPKANALGYRRAR